MNIKKLQQVWQTKDLRNNILFVVAMLFIYRLTAHIPIPGVDRNALNELFSGNQALGLLNIFSGGGLTNFSIMALGVAPYITASIVMQLLAMVVPKLEQLQKEGEAGYNKINQYTRWLTVPFSIIQAVGIISLLKSASPEALAGLSGINFMAALVAMTAGSVFLMWIGELITEKHVGNGISILIFAGILAGLPSAISNSVAVFDSTQLLNWIFFAIIGLVTIVAIIYITGGQRNIPVSYAKIIRGTRIAGGAQSHLPIKVNQAGVIPIIFAISIVLFPPVIARFFLSAETAWIAQIAEWVITMFNNQLIYGILYFVLVVAFTYFYTAIVFQPERIAENLQKQGGYVPGIRPGKPTEEYLQFVSNRIMLTGALFLGGIAVLPLVVQEITGLQTLVIGGTSLLIVVSVVMEIVHQIESQLTMRDYESL